MPRNAARPAVQYSTSPTRTSAHPAVQAWTAPLYRIPSRCTGQHEPHVPQRILQYRLVQMVVDPLPTCVACESYLWHQDLVTELQQARHISLEKLLCNVSKAATGYCDARWLGHTTMPRLVFLKGVLVPNMPATKRFFGFRIDHNVVVRKVVGGMFRGRMLRRADVPAS